MPETQETKPLLPSERSADRPPERSPHSPFWMPAGGRGALYFWGGLCLLLAFGLVCFYRHASSADKENRQLSDQTRLLLSERDKLRSQIDMLQTEVSQQGLQIKSSEETLREAKQTLQAAQAQSDQQGQQSEAVKRNEADLQAALQKALPSQDGVTVAGGAAGDGVLVVRLANAALFDNGDVTLNPKGTDLLKKIAAVLKASPAVAAVDVGGHSDPAAPSAAGKPAPNIWDMSVRRAASVVHLLTDNGVPEPLLTAQGFGATRPLVSNDGPDRAKNRRVEIAVRVNGAAPAPAG